MALKCGIKDLLPDDPNKVLLGNGNWGAPPAGGGAAWGAITGTLAEQTDLSGALGGKAPSSHAHGPSDITGTAIIDSDSRLTNARTPTSHGHPESEVTNLVTDLAGKAASSHGHAPSDVTGTAVVTADSRLSDARVPTSHGNAQHSSTFITAGDVHSNANDPAAGEKAALAGTSGTPGSGNKFVTDGDARNTNARTPSAHGHGPSEITGTAVITTDSRLSDARTPTAHNHAATDINSATLDGDRLPALSTTKKGGVPATGTPSGLFLKDNGTWAAAGGGGSPTGVFSDLQISVLQSDGTLNAASGVQTWCGTNKTAQDVFTLVANKTYRFRAQLIYNTGATTHTTAFAFSFGGTVTRCEYLALVWAAAANTIATAQSTTHVSGIASKVIIATSTAVYTIIRLEGIFVVGASGGACTPQINFSANPTGTNLLKAGSYFSFELLGADTLAAVGGWA